MRRCAAQLRIAAASYENVAVYTTPLVHHTAHLHSLATVDAWSMLHSWAVECMRSGVVLVHSSVFAQGGRDGMSLACCSSRREDRQPDNFLRTGMPAYCPALCCAGADQDDQRQERIQHSQQSTADRWHPSGGQSTCPGTSRPEAKSQDGQSSSKELVVCHSGQLRVPDRVLCFRSWDSICSSSAAGVSCVATGLLWQQLRNCWSVLLLWQLKHAVWHVTDITTTAWCLLVTFQHPRLMGPDVGALCWQRSHCFVKALLSWPSLPSIQHGAMHSVAFPGALYMYAVLYDPQHACYLQCLDHEHRGSCMGLGALLLHVTCKRTAARLGMHGHWLQRVLCTLCMLHGRQRGPAVAL